MIQTVKDTLLRYEMVSPGDKVLCALSGGADSSSLCYALTALKEKLQISLCAVHINHKLRGEESTRDEAFSKALCEKLEIEWISYGVDIAKIAARENKSLELCAREQRYRLFEKGAQALGANRIATAHTANDNAETLLFNVIRGTGITGLCGIPHKRGNIIRPLLNVTRQEIEEFMTENHFSYVTDSTNQSCDYTRNKLRNIIIPLIEKEINPSFVKSASVLTRHMAALNAHNDELWDYIIEESKDGLGLSISELEELDEFELSNVLKRYFFKKTGISMDSCHILKTAEFIRQHKNGQLSLLQGFVVRVSYGKLYIEKKRLPPKPFAKKLCMGENYIDEIGLEIRLTLEEDLNVYSLLNNAVFDYDKIPSNIVARSRKTGDLYPLPNGHIRTVKRLFIDQKTDTFQRERIPVFETDGEIIWILGFPPVKKYLPDEHTKRFLKIGAKEILKLFTEGQIHDK